MQLSAAQVRTWVVVGCIAAALPGSVAARRVRGRARCFEDWVARRRCSRATSRRVVGVLGAVLGAVLRFLLGLLVPYSPLAFSIFWLALTRRVTQQEALRRSYGLPRL